MILLAIHISIRVRCKIEGPQHITKIADSWRKEAEDLISLLNESQLCFSAVTYRLPEGNLAVKRDFRCTNVKKTHTHTAEVQIPHYSNKQLFTADVSCAFITHWFVSLRAFFGYGYYPRWEGDFQPHRNVITPEALKKTFENAIQDVFTKKSKTDCLSYAAMLLKSLTDNDPIKVSETVENEFIGKVQKAIVEIIYCNICFTKGGNLCTTCKKLWDTTEISIEWQLEQ